MSEFYRPLRQELSKNPENLKAMFTAINSSKGSITKANTCFIDSVFGVPILKSSQEYIQTTNPNTGEVRYLDFPYEGTSYDNIRNVLETVKPSKDDTVMDIGSGYGRFCLFGALTTDASFVGIETVQKRYEAAQAAKESLDIPNVAFTDSDVLNYDLSNGSIFYMFNPFYPFGFDAQWKVEEKLRELSRKKPIQIVTLSMTGVFPMIRDGQFEEVERISTRQMKLQFYKSKPIT